MKNLKIVSYKTAIIPSKMIAVFICSLLIGAFGLAGLNAKAAQNNIGSDPKEENSFRYKDGERIEDEMLIEEDGLSIRYKPKKANANAWKLVDGQYLSSNGKPIPGAIAKGVDVSYHNGTIDWEKVKADGIDFAIIRCGYGMDQTDQDDKQWVNNAKKCSELGIPFGVYLYSYANTSEKALSEAEHVLRLVKGYKLSMPIYYDLEDTIVEKAGTAQILENTKIFTQKLESAGYTVGIYANLYWFNTFLTDAYYDKYEKWVAQYNTTCNYTKPYYIWQSTSEGTVSGIGSKSVDLNFMLNTAPVSAKITGIRQTENGNEVTFIPGIGATSYDLYRMNSANVSTYIASKGINEKKEFLDTTVKSLSGYRYYIVTKRDFKSQKGSVKTDAIKPLAKTSISVAYNTYNSLKITWKKISGANGYKLYRKSGTTYKLIKTLSGETNCSYIDTKLTCGKTYNYIVRAYQTLGGVKILGNASIKGKDATPKPPKPEKLTLKNSGHYIKVKWSKVKGCHGYLIYRRTGTKGSFTRIKTISKSTTLSFTDKTVKKKKTYYYKVRGYRTVSGKKVYGAYSKAYKLKAK
ncbi:MAG: hypothetical protein K6G65_10025 [Lachnospiraceae bacterium]|nr:hypothetical protein [Lachnospiraceae bacterium]